MEGLQLLREFGFPILVCAWFMFRLEKKLDRINQTQHRLVTAISKFVSTNDFEGPEDDDNGSS